MKRSALKQTTQAEGNGMRQRSSRSLANLEDRLLELANLDLTALRWAWREAHGREAPSGLGREFLLRFLSHRLQIQQLGDLDGKTKRILDRLASGDASVIAAPTGLGMNLKPGTLLVREYKEEMHRVTVMAEGYAWRGQTYLTLSAVARAITGANWNGYVFFGLKKKGETTEDSEASHG
jgi:hypothetical protein